eukprot:TRINITY_DN1471_c0_g3_i1.p1 TRINITY_DN1471_c0_g3~~TRINITY_DN1471_c0_g3_i1.p1  ORF type:complete len:309 (-),score=25.25 TRINITY_DN1471_c0_g3_i1:154-1080(-)
MEVVGLHNDAHARLVKTFQILRIGTLCERQTNLTSINLNFQSYLPEADLMALNTMCPVLRSLNLTYCTQVSSKIFGSILKMPFLTDLNLTGCTSIEPHELRLIFQTLQLIKFTCQYLVLPDNLVDAPYPSLTYLDLYSCKNFTDETIKLIGTFFVNLLTLNLFSVKDLRDSGVDMYLKANQCPKLLDLDLGSSWSNLSADSIILMASSCKMLQRLSLRCLSQVNDSTIQLLSTVSPSLETLELRSTSVTAGAIVHFAKFPRLAKLDLSQLLLESSGELILNKCPTIQTIILSSTLTMQRPPQTRGNYQ